MNSELESWPFASILRQHTCFRHSLCFLNPQGGLFKSFYSMSFTYAHCSVLSIDRQQMSSSAPYSLPTFWFEAKTCQLSLLRPLLTFATGVSRSASPSFPCWIPAQSVSCYIRDWFSERVAYPSPFPSSYYVTRWFLLWSSPQFHVGNFIEPPNAKYPSQAFVNECLNFGYGVFILSSMFPSHIIVLILR